MDQCQSNWYQSTRRAKVVYSDQDPVGLDPSQNEQYEFWESIGTSQDWCIPAYNIISKKQF